MKLKLTLEEFVKPELINEVFSMDVQNQDAVKTRLFGDLLKYMQAFSQLAAKGNLDVASKSAGLQDFITRLSDFESYFQARGTKLTMSGFDSEPLAPGIQPTQLLAFDAVENNKKAFLTAIASGTEFVPIVWSKALMTQPGQALAPIYYKPLYNTAAKPVLGSAPGSKFNNVADTSAPDKIALDRPDANLQRANTTPKAPATGEFYRYAK